MLRGRKALVPYISVTWAACVTIISNAAGTQAWFIVHDLASLRKVHNRIPTSMLLGVLEANSR